MSEYVTKADEVRGHTADLRLNTTPKGRRFTPCAYLATVWGQIATSVGLVCRHVDTHAGCILRSPKLRELSVLLPLQFELTLGCQAVVVALDLSILPPLLARADEVTK